MDSVSFPGDSYAQRVLVRSVFLAEERTIISRICRTSGPSFISLLAPAHEKLLRGQRERESVQSMDIDRALKFTFFLHLELGRSCITSIIAANHIFLASCALGVRVRCRRHHRLSKNLPLSQSPPYLPFVHGSAPLSKATRARVSEAWRRGGLRKNSAGALLEKKVCVDSAGRASAGNCPNSETASIHSTKAILHLPSSLHLSPSVAWLPSSTWPVSESYSHCLCERRSPSLSAYLCVISISARHRRKRPSTTVQGV